MPYRSGHGSLALVSLIYFSERHHTIMALYGRNAACANGAMNAFDPDGRDVAWIRALQIHG